MIVDGVGAPHERRIREQSRSVVPTREADMKKLTLRPFTESDWDVFAGAELFADGSQPLVQYSDPGGYALVVDGNGINVNLVQDHDDPTCATDVWVFTFVGVRSQKHGVALLNALLPGGVSREALAAASFEIVGTC